MAAGLHLASQITWLVLACFDEVASYPNQPGGYQDFFRAAPEGEARPQLVTRV